MVYSPADHRRCRRRSVHSAIILDPDNQVLELAEHVVGCRQHLARVAPIHAYEVYRAVDTYLRETAVKLSVLFAPDIGCLNIDRLPIKAMARLKSNKWLIFADSLLFISISSYHHDFCFRFWDQLANLSNVVLFACGLGSRMSASSYAFVFDQF